jgi:PAP2 superfamily
MAFKMWALMSALAGLMVVSGSPPACMGAHGRCALFCAYPRAMYDAWTAYDSVAVGAFSGSALRGKGGPATVANKREAVSHAAYQVLRELAPVRRRALAEYMAGLGYDTNANSGAAIVGRRAAQAVLAAARDDGANQGSNYQDTSGYHVAEPPTGSSWQPIDEMGSSQLPVSPHWGRVMTFALRSADEFRPAAPPPPGSPEWYAQIREVQDVSADIGDEQKAMAEFWVPWGGSPASHLTELTKFISARDDLRLDEEVKLFFLVSIALHDAAIAVWDAKYHYDYVRPITAMRSLGDTRMAAWRSPELPTAFAYSAPATRDARPFIAGRGKSIVDMAAKNWQPYLPTPAFPAYVSGHSAFTAAWAQVVELVTGRREFGFHAAVRRLYIEQRLLDHPIQIDFPTLWSAAESSGVSRIYGGIHWPADNREGLVLGKAVAERAWERGQQLILGTASPFAAAVSNLTPAHWHLKTSPIGSSSTAGGQLQVMLAAGEEAVWQSIALDAPPAGAYRMSIAGEWEGATPATVQATVRTASDRDADLGSAELNLVLPGSWPLSIDWVSDGSTPCRLELRVSIVGGAGRSTFKEMNFSRQWPLAQGAPRFREMSSLSR